MRLGGAGHLHGPPRDVLGGEAVDVYQGGRGDLRVDAAAPDPNHPAHRLQDVPVTCTKVKLAHEQAPGGLVGLLQVRWGRTGVVLRRQGGHLKWRR